MNSVKRGFVPFLIATLGKEEDIDVFHDEPKSKDAPIQVFVMYHGIRMRGTGFRALASVDVWRHYVEDDCAEQDLEEAVARVTDLLCPHVAFQQWQRLPDLDNFQGVRILVWDLNR